MKAPDFTLKETNGQEISLSDYLGKKNVVLYFYPRDNTKGCAIEASEFRDLHEEFERLDTVILGISKDSLKSHAKFSDKLDLQFLLLSDEDKKVHEMYGVLKPKKMYGKEYLGVERSTFIIDKKGNIVKEFRKVKAKGHAEEVLEFIKENL
ncbi:MAG: thioredoxin-dependent thiol peroxidase [Clostridiaceae bacterium]|nr:thioredoxin-dependent thiol peroxidase [Clostridiaceae bacterium]MBW4860736.1 thioredoxin-dependent thiol peroxidase [Clostridiaceae bacterium]MBW4869010.1 thioredoxin-dependent thiol peroxidase [Clostridiaceae bacterium]